MPQLDYTTFASQIFWLVLTFVTLYLALSRKALPAIRDVLQARQDRIAHDLEKAEIARAEAEEAKFNYTSALEKARQNASHTLIETFAAVKKESHLRHTALDAKLAQQANETEKRITTIKSEAQEQLQPVSLMLAELIGSKLMGAQFDKEKLATLLGNKH